jgi:hypothetical protein
VDRSAERRPPRRKAARAHPARAEPFARTFGKDVVTKSAERLGPRVFGLRDAAKLTMATGTGMLSTKVSGTRPVPKHAFDGVEDRRRPPTQPRSEARSGRSSRAIRKGSPRLSLTAALADYFPAKTRSIVPGLATVLSQRFNHLPVVSRSAFGRAACLSVLQLVANLLGAGADGGAAGAERSGQWRSGWWRSGWCTTDGEGLVNCRRRS